MGKDRPRLLAQGSAAAFPGEPSGYSAAERVRGPAGPTRFLSQWRGRVGFTPTSVRPSLTTEPDDRGPWHRAARDQTPEGVPRVVNRIVASAAAPRSTAMRSQTPALPCPG